MSGYLLDTDIISELWKRRPNPAVVSWVNSQDPGQLFLSVMTLAEIKLGALRLKPRDRRRSDRLLEMAATIPEEYGDRVLLVDAAVAGVWAAINANRSRPVVDTILAATAISNQLTLVTRNTADFEDVDVKLYNPFLEGFTGGGG